MVSQKMKATASNKGFTLVELIVVITILAILGTIGFISIQGYSAQSRDSKRTSDLRALSSALTIKATDGMPLTSFVTTNTLTAMNSGSLGGTGVTNALADYVAGYPNYTALGVSKSNFVDGVNEYRIASTTRDGGGFQLAATLENAGGTKTALVTGNYAARTNAAFTASGTTTAANTAFTISNLNGAGVGFFNKGDIVMFATTAGTTIGTGSVQSVSGDGKGISVTSPYATVGTNITTVYLGNFVGASVPLANYSEITGLIATTAGTTGFGTGAGSGATNGGTYLPY